MASAVYYTFSTVAQTLAAAIALLAAFLLYRLQTLNKGLDEYMSQIVGHYSSTVRLQLDEFRAQEKYADFAELCAKSPVSSGDDPTNTPRQRLLSLYSHRQSAYEAFYRSLRLTVGLITSSVAALVLAPLYQGHTLLSAVVLGCGGLWFVWCVRSYSLLVKATLV